LSRIRSETLVSRGEICGLLTHPEAGHPTNYLSNKIHECHHQLATSNFPMCLPSTVWYQPKRRIWYKKRILIKNKTNETYFWWPIICFLWNNLSFNSCLFFMRKKIKGEEKSLFHN
jgi:hypothetical protein